MRVCVRTFLLDFERETGAFLHTHFVGALKWKGMEYVSVIHLLYMYIYQYYTYRLYIDISSYDLDDMWGKNKRRFGCGIIVYLKVNTCC